MSLNDQNLGYYTYESYPIFKNTELIKELELIIKLNTDNRSPESIRKFILFYNKVCYCLQLDHNCYDEYSNLIISEDDHRILVTKQNYSNVVIKYERWLKQICKFIFKCKIPDNLPKEIDLTYKVKQEIKNPYHYMKKEELEELWRVSDDIDKGLMLILLTTGMRVGALAQISKDKINDQGIVVLTEKGNLVKKYKLTQQSLYYINNTKFFDSPKNKTSINRRIKKVARRSNLEKIDHIHPHTFRHTFAKILVEKGLPIEKISLIMGHSSIDVTRDVYLQETAMDLINQGLIPWFKKEDTTIIPDFLVFD